MNDENNGVEVDAIEAETNEIEPAQSEVEAKAAEEKQPEPVQDEAEAERKAQKRAERRERKEYYEMKAKTEYLEREIQRLQPQKAVDESGEMDLETLIEQKVTEREAKKAADAYFNKSKQILEKAMQEIDADDYIDVPRGAADAIVELDNPKLLVYLQNNPEEIERLQSLSYGRQMAEMGRLDAKLSAPAAAKKSAAPSPIKPVTGSKTSDVSYREDMSDAEYDKWLSQQYKAAKQ